jgi:hypothetical protein
LQYLIQQLVVEAHSLALAVFAVCPYHAVRDGDGPSAKVRLAPERIELFPQANFRILQNVLGILP